MKFLTYFLLSTFLLVSCNTKEKEMSQLPDDSIFHLTTEWKNQNNESLKLKDLKGKTLVLVMIYTSCKTACPILVGKMKQIESKIDSKDAGDIDFVLVSIDPEVDTPERLKKFAKDNAMDGPQWTFLTSNEDETQVFANVLAVKYKKISPIDFSHSNIITIFNPNGELVTQEEGLEIDVDKIAKDATNVARKSKKK